MKRLALPLIAASLLSPGLSFAQDPAQPEPQKPSKLRLFKAAGIGCVAGAATGYLFKNHKKGLIAGCGAGTLVGGVASYQKQLKEFRALEAEARAAGFDAEVHTKSVQAKDGPSEALDKLVIRYSVADMKPVSPQTAATLDKLGRLLNASKERLTVTFSGVDRAVCQGAVAELAMRAAFQNATVEDRCGQGDQAITVSPIPDVR